MVVWIVNHENAYTHCENEEQARAVKAALKSILNAEIFQCQDYLVAEYGPDITDLVEMGMDEDKAYGMAFACQEEAALYLREHGFDAVVESLL